MTNQQTKNSVHRRIVWSSQHLDRTQYPSSITLQKGSKTKKIKIENLVQTPAGVFHVDDDFNPYNKFQLWMADCNFDVTLGDAEVIENTPGVEVFIPVTRYKFIVGIAPLFKSSDVKINLQKNLGVVGPEESMALSLTENTEIMNVLSRLAKKLSENEYWFIYMFPNGKVTKFFVKELNKEFQAKFKFIKNVQSISNGILVSHETEQSYKSEK